MRLAEIRRAIVNDSANVAFTEQGWEPIYTAHSSAKILIIGQAPGRIAQETNRPWNDLSGDNLRSWLGVSRDEFYDEKVFALIPMDFYYPGTRAGGDNPPRKGFAETWHPLILEQMKDIRLTILLGQYSQELYLGARRKKTLTETVRAYTKYLPIFLPLVHPSPRNNIWQKKNPWFKQELVPTLQGIVERALATKD